MKYYVGHPLQERGAEQYTLHGGKGEGMNFLYVRNGKGLELWISLDRCADMTRVIYCGKNMGYLSPCGNVAPAYYDNNGMGFLKSFSAGFFTTCGFNGVGGPCHDEGEDVPLHGTIGNMPAELNGIEEDENGLTIKATVRDCVIFGRRMVMERTYTVSYLENEFTVSDTVTNEGNSTSPYLILYHCNMGYPLLNENSIVRFPNERFWAETDNAKETIDTALIMEKPQQNYAERCYFFDAAVGKNNKVHAGIFNPDIDAGVVFSYDKEQLPCLTEWKMMGRRDYVLGIEPGNCFPCPRDKMREKGVIKYLDPDQSNTTSVSFKFTDTLDSFESEF